MSLRLTDNQRTRVEQNMPLVARVLKSCVHNPNQCGIFSYDDLYQYGCIGLCNAASSYSEDGDATFETYAYLLIRNEIFKQLEYATRRKQREIYTEPEDASAILPSETDAGDGLDSLLCTMASNTSGIIAKGIEAIRLQAQGYSCKEIGQHFDGASDNNVSAWISRARKYLRQTPAIAELAP